MNCRFPHLVRHTHTFKLSGVTYELQVPTFGEALIPLSCQVLLMNCRFPHLVRHSHTFKLSGNTYELQVCTFGEVLSDFEVVR
jgi:hypothetical protein